MGMTIFGACGGFTHSVCPGDGFMSLLDSARDFYQYRIKALIQASADEQHKGEELQRRKSFFVCGCRVEAATLRF